MTQLQKFILPYPLLESPSLRNTTTLQTFVPLCHASTWTKIILPAASYDILINTANRTTSTQGFITTTSLPTLATGGINNGASFAVKSPKVSISASIYRDAQNVPSLHRRMKLFSLPQPNFSIAHRHRASMYGVVAIVPSETAAVDNPENPDFGIDADTYP
jgi:hypothetical protein